MKLLPTGSYLQLTKSLNIPGLGVNNKLTANGVATATQRCVQYIARDENSYWILMPAGPHRGWKEIPFTLVEFCHCAPPQELLDLVKEREAPPTTTDGVALTVEHPTRALPDQEREGSTPSPITPISAMTPASAKPQKRSKTPQA